MEKIIIVAACDDKYSSHAGALAASIFANNSEVAVEFNLLTDYLSEENRRKFEQLATKFHQIVHIVDVDKSRFESLPIGEAFEDHINVCTYYRLLIPSILQDVNKLIYLDCDMIVRESLLPLWQEDVEGYAFAGVMDIASMQRTCPLRLHYPVAESYYNSGMCVYNLRYLREHAFDDIVSDFITHHADLIVCHDQDIMNACFHGQYKPVPEKWNMLNDFLAYRYEYNGEDVPSFESAKRDPAIVHFTTAIKPWHAECQNPYTDEYWKYLRMTPWKDERPVRFFPSSRQSFLYRMKWGLKRVLAGVGIKRGYVRR